MKRLKQTGWYVLKDPVDKFYEDNKEYAGNDLRMKSIVKVYEKICGNTYKEWFKHTVS